MTHRLPILMERAVREAETERQRLVEEFETKLRVYLADEPATVMCQKGCNHCCYYPVVVSLLEGVTLFRWLSEHGLWRKALQDKFKEAHKAVWGLSPTVWMLSMTPCPLLNAEGLCDAYEGRPFMCRTTVSVRNPDFCHPHRFAEGLAGLVNRIEADRSLQEVENRLLKNTRLTLLRLPLSTAVLMGERLSKEDLAPEDISDHLFEEWARNC